MAVDERIAALRQVELFAGCSDKQLRSITRLCSPINVKEGFVLTTQGAVGKECFVVADGDARVVIDGAVVAKVGRGDCVGEMALLDGGIRSATVTATTPMTVYAMNGPEFRILLESTPVSRKIMTALAHRLRIAETALAH